MLVNWKVFCNADSECLIVVFYSIFLFPVFYLLLALKVSLILSTVTPLSQHEEITVSLFIQHKTVKCINTILFFFWITISFMWCFAMMLVVFFCICLFLFTKSHLNLCIKKLEQLNFFFILLFVRHNFMFSFSS